MKRRINDVKQQALLLHNGLYTPYFKICQPHYFLHCQVKFSIAALSKKYGKRNSNTLYTLFQSPSSLALV
jgi:hypothetical protein